MLSRVQHKNLVKFIGACKVPIMAIDYSHRALDWWYSSQIFVQHVARVPGYPCNTWYGMFALGFALDIARGMECLHSHGIIHRDLKVLMLPRFETENLLVSADQKRENNKTSRLWIGKRRDTDRDNDRTAETRTYRWMAPELYSTVTLRQGKKKHCNNKGDAYSFAIVLWELLHNKLPFEECEA